MECQIYNHNKLVSVAECSLREAYARIEKAHAMAGR